MTLKVGLLTLEKYIVPRIQEALKTLHIKTRIIWKTNTAENACLQLRRKTPDIIIIDWGISQGEAYTMLKYLDQYSGNLFFIIAAPNQPVQIFHVSEFRKSDNINNTLQEANGIYHITNSRLKKLPGNTLEEKPDYPIFFKAFTRDSYKLIPLVNIIRCEADGSYSIVYAHEESPVVVSKSLSQVEVMLGKPNFVRIHHKHIVNLDFIKQHVDGRGGYIILKDNSVIQIAQRKREKFIERVRKLNPSLLQ